MAEIFIKQQNVKLFTLSIIIFLFFLTEGIMFIYKGEWIAFLIHAVFTITSLGIIYSISNKSRQLLDKINAVRRLEKDLEAVQNPLKTIKPL